LLVHHHITSHHITLYQVHLYAEGKVNQPDAYLTDENGVAHLPRFKWGVYVVLVQFDTRYILLT